MSDQEFREDLAVLRFWKKNFKSDSARQAIDRAIYYLIVNWHRSRQGEDF